LVEVRLGTAEEVSEVRGDPPPASGQAVGKSSHRHRTYLRQHARSVAGRAAAFWREQGCDWLVIGGVEQALGDLREQIPKDLRARLAGELHLSPQVEPGKILERVLEIERQHEQQLEAQRVDQMLSEALKGGAAVLGLEATLLALVEGRASLLVVEEEFSQAGWECPNCRFIGALELENCPLCGTALKLHPDVVELALERVLDQKGNVEVLRSLESRRALARFGRIGALLRYAYSSAQAEEDERQQPGTPVSTPTQDNEIIDVALELTFPASDPPFWMP
jgi:peptide subunit release factor 1 (eRF1)